MKRRAKRKSVGRRSCGLEVMVLVMVMVCVSQSSQLSPAGGLGEAGVGSQCASTTTTTTTSNLGTAGTAPTRLAASPLPRLSYPMTTSAIPIATTCTRTSLIARLPQGVFVIRQLTPGDCLHQVSFMLCHSIRVPLIIPDSQIPLRQRPVPIETHVPPLPLHPPPPTSVYTLD